MKNFFLKGKWKLLLFYNITGSFQRSRVFFSFKNNKCTPTFHRILLSNLGSFGDVVLSSGVIATIKARYPDCKIGFLVSSKSKSVLETCPYVDWIHVMDVFLDSWSAEKRTKWQKLYDLLHFVFIQQAKLATEIAAIEYDCAFELRPFFINSIPVFWKARIPLRIGFTSSGNSSLLNNSVDWTHNQYIAHCYWDLLEKIGIYKEASLSLIPAITLDFISKEPSIPYIIFHVCSADKVKELSMTFWNDLYQLCLNQGYSIYFTGQGNRENAIISSIVNQAEYNLCDKLSWKQLVSHIQRSHGIVSVDSVPVHLAASFQVPCAVLFKATPFPNLWKPNITSTVAFGIKNEVRVEEVFAVVKQWIT